jgi:guanine deaminase
METGEPNPFMREAIRLSREMIESNQGGPFGAVIVKEGQIIGRGWNQVLLQKDPTAHAEVTAIRAACATLNDFRLAGCDLYTSCEPCPMCLAAIYWARIDRIFFGNSREDASRIGFDDEVLYQEMGLPLERRKIPLIQLMRTEALSAFDLWSRKADRVTY